MSKQDIVRQLIEQLSVPADMQEYGAFQKTPEVVNHSYRVGYLECAKEVSKVIFHRVEEAEKEATRLRAENAELLRDIKCSFENTDAAIDDYNTEKARADALQAEVDRMREAASNAAMYLKSGFIECPRCGEEVKTEDTDAEYELRQALGGSND